jgi:hypothetical protein
MERNPANEMRFSRPELEDVTGDPLVDKPRLV